MAKSRSSSSAKSPAAPKETTTSSRATRGSAKRRSSDDTGNLHSPEGDGNILSQDTLELSPELEQPDELELSGSKKIPEGMRRSEYKQISDILNNPLCTYWKWDDFKQKIQRKLPKLEMDVINKHDGVMAIQARQRAHLQAWLNEKKKGKTKQTLDQDEEEESSEEESDDEDDDDDNLSVDGETGDRVKWPPDDERVPHQDRWFGIQPDQRTSYQCICFGATIFFFLNLFVSESTSSKITNESLKSVILKSYNENFSVNFIRLIFDILSNVSSESRLEKI
jgi:hypothetical protein